MTFIKFPVFFTEDQSEFKSELGLDLAKEKGEITINTNALCAYNENDNGHVMLRMSNGDCWELPMKMKEFEKILHKGEAMIQLINVENN